MKTFISDRPCRNGHVGERYIATNSCAICARSKSRSKYLSDPEADHRKNAEWRKNNKERHVRNAVDWAKRNIERRREIAKQWARRARPYRKAYAAFAGSLRKARIKRATPAWANKEKIFDIYRTAQDLSIATGVIHHVDHIIPIAGKYVCGLHVENNLRPIPAPMNREKYNKIDVEAI